MPPALQKPLLPLRRDGGPASPVPPLAGRRPGSQQSSPAKELLAAVEHGDAGGALRVAGVVCLRNPLLLLLAAVALLGVAGLATWLLPQQPLPAMLLHAAHRDRSPRQRAYFEELTQQELQLVETVERSQRQAASIEGLDADVAGAQGGQGLNSVQQQTQQPRPPDATAPDDTEPMFDIHQIAGVPQLFGAQAAGQQGREPPRVAAAQ